MNALGAALTKVGLGGTARLAVRAWERLKEAGNNPRRALAAFLKEVQRDDELMEALALDYLSQRARDIEGKQRAEGRSVNDAQSSDAPATLPETPEGGQCRDDAQFAGARPS